jgi:protein transport protein SEC61 subunit gamma-like protein
MENNVVEPGVFGKIKSFVIQSKRVWQVLKKPSNEEFRSVAKVAALGILALGFIGFVVADVMKLF